jgi:hypothetical protein
MKVPKLPSEYVCAQCREVFSWDAADPEWTDEDAWNEALEQFPETRVMTVVCEGCYQKLFS